MTHSETVAPVLTLEQARCTVEDHARRMSPPGVESVDLLESLGRVLASPLVADRDMPAFDRSTRDGYAVRAADLAVLPARLNVVGETRAGASGTLSRPLQPGEAIEIMTGAALPAGADAVVMVEYTTRHGEVVELRQSASAGDNFVPRGREARQSDVLLPAGVRVDAAAIAVAASLGSVRVPVFMRPRVAVLATGDELVELDSKPGPTQIRNSNTYSVAAQAIGAGAEPVILPIGRDDPDHLRASILEGLKADLLILTGGVSMGKYDLVENVLTELGAECFFVGALIQPGRPVVFGRMPNGAGWKYFFGLPGNPVSTMVTFELFVRPMVDALGGAALRPLRFSSLRLKGDFRTGTGLTRLLPARTIGQMGATQVEVVRWQGSGDIAAQAQANCYLVVPPDRELLRSGEMVNVLLR